MTEQNAIEVFAAKSVMTMDKTHPRATHIAVREGRVLAVGTKTDLAQWKEQWGAPRAQHDFANKIILPGFVEGHSHMMEGLLWDYAYVGYYDREGPDGRIHRGLKTIDEVVAHLQKCDAARTDRSAPLIAWGFDPIFFDDRRMNLADLDKVRDDCAVVVLHASLHILNANGYVMDAAGIDANDNSDAIRRDENGKPSGEFLGQLGMYMALRVTGLNLLAAAGTPQALRNFAAVARQAGVTTATDLANPLDDDTVKILVAETRKDDFPVRLVVALSGNGREAKTGIARLKELAPQNHDKLRMSLVKLVADGSIQGFSARLRWPYYHNGTPNGLWYIEPDTLKALIKDYHAGGCHIHVHTNGDACTELALDAFEAALAANPRPDHRHTLQHCQMASHADFTRMRALGIAANLFSNHIYYWGDAHITATLGRDRADRIDNAGGCLEAGVPLAIHSDAPVTALGPLFTAWCAVNRQTAKGTQLGGDAEKISTADALYAITLGAAYTLKMDGEIGSIEIGKRADFAILDDDPECVDPNALKDIGIHATVLDGTIHKNAARQIAK